MAPTPLAPLLNEFHQHRLGATIEDAEFVAAEAAFFDDIVRGVIARRDEIDAYIVALLAEGWRLERLDRPMRALLRAGVYELLARADVPAKVAIDEYLDVADAFYAVREKRFVNGLLDAAAKRLREINRGNAPPAPTVERAKEIAMTMTDPNATTTTAAPGEPAPAHHPEQQAGQDDTIAKRLRRNPENPDAQLDRGLDESMDASDPPTAAMPGDSGKPLPSSGFDPEAEAKLQN
jgi:N utilization substance protein B